MAKKLNEIFKHMVEQYGVSVSDATIKSILDNPSLASIEVDDAVSTKLTTPLLTMDAAKNNPDLQRHFTAIALNGADAEMERLVTEFGLTDEQKSALKAERSTYKRIDLLTKEIAKAEAAKAGASKGDKTVLEKDIERLNGEMKTLRETFDSEKKALQESMENERVSWKQDSVYSKLLPQMDSTKDADFNILVAREYTRKELQKNGWKVVSKDGNIAVVNAETGAEAYDKTNNKVGFDDFVAKTLANNKLLVPNQKQPGQPNTPQPPRTPATPPANGINGSRFLAETEN